MKNLRLFPIAITAIAATSTLTMGLAAEIPNSDTNFFGRGPLHDLSVGRAQSKSPTISNSGDVLIAGPGSDFLQGTDENDVFVFQKEFTIIVDGTEQMLGGYGGDDIITNYKARAGTGDTIKLRNLANQIQIDILNQGIGDTLLVLSSIFVDPETGLQEDNRQQPDAPVFDPSTGEIVALPGNTFQTITVTGVSANELMTQGLVEVNDIPLNETTQGLIRAFGNFRFVIGDLNTNFPSRPGGAVGNFIVGDPFFGQPGAEIENNLVTGSFVTEEEIARVLKKIIDAFPEGITIPGTEVNLSDEVREALEAEKVIGEIPTPLLPQNAFSFAIDEQGAVDLSRFTPTADSSTTGDDTLIGNVGNDLLIGGPGNDTIVGGPGSDIIWAGLGQDLIIGREGVDYIIFNSILDIRDRDIPEQDPLSTALADSRLGYIRFEEPYGTPLTFISEETGEEVENPFTTKTGPDIIFVNAEAFNRGIDPETNPELAEQIGYLQPGTIITGDGTGPAAEKKGQLFVGTATVPRSDGPADDDRQPTFYYNPTAARLFFDRDGTGEMFFDFWMAEMGTGTLRSDFPPGTPNAAPDILICIY